MASDDIVGGPPEGGPDSAAVNMPTRPGGQPGIEMDSAGREAVRKLMHARTAAAAAGDKFSPEDEEAFIREETGNRYGGKDASDFLDMAKSINPIAKGSGIGGAAVNGALMGWEPELIAKLTGDPQQADAIRLRNEVFGHEHPTTSHIAGILGAIAPFLAGGPEAALMKEAPLAARVGAGAATGAATGAAAGAGYAGPQNRLNGAVAGGTAGLGLGAAAPLAGEAVGRVAGEAAPSEGWINAWKRDPSLDPASLEPAAKEAMRKQVAAEIVAKNGKGFEGAQDNIQKLYGDEATFAKHLDAAHVDRYLNATAPAKSNPVNAGDLAAGMAGHLILGGHAAGPAAMALRAGTRALADMTAARAAPSAAKMLTPAMDPIEQLLAHLQGPTAGGAAGSAAPAAGLPPAPPGLLQPGVPARPSSP